jgi:hypothetical protein
MHASSPSSAPQSPCTRPGRRYRLEVMVAGMVDR